MRNIVTTLLVIAYLSIAANTVTFAQVGEWVEKQDMPTARYSMGAAVVGENIYVIGGWAHKWLSTVEMYDTRRDVWEPKADLSQGSLGVAAATVNSKLYAIGGWTSGGTFLNTVEEYDQIADTWTQKANMPTRRNWGSTAVVDGIIYVIGGIENNNYSSAVEAYDPVADQWSKKANLPMSGICSAVAVDEKIYAMGFSAPNARPNVYEYDLTTDKWTEKAGIPTNRRSMSVVAIGKHIYAIGGTPTPKPLNKLTTVEIYDTKTDTWLDGVDLPDARANHVSTVLNGKIYAIGGVDEWANCCNAFPESVLPTVQVFDTGLSVSLPGKLTTTWGSVKYGGLDDMTDKVR